MIQVPGFSCAMARKLGQCRLSTMSLAKIGMSSVRHISWKLTIELFFHASVSGSFIQLCLIKMVMNFYLIGLAQLAVGRTWRHLQVICALLACLQSLSITSSFILNPQIPENAALQSWCLANATKIKQLPPMTAMQAIMVKSAAPPPTDAINIINLPTSVDKVKLINVKGIARVTDFNQRFHYLACSLCNKASNAYENDELWCNYCARRVSPLTRVKFNIQVSDPTASIDATIFPEIAEQFYGITGTNIDTTEPDAPLLPELLDQLAEPKKCNVTLKAYMNTYAGISQCKFNVYSMSAIPKPTLDDNQNLQQPPALPPATPVKNEKNTAASTSTHETEQNPTKKPKLN